MSVDVQLTQVDQLYDISIDESTGDFDLTDGLDTSLIVSLFSDARAAPDEVTDAARRRGWLGDLASDVPERVFGSKLWLLEQSRLTSSVAAFAGDYANMALAWMIDDGAATAVEVAPAISNGNLDLDITFTTVDGVTSSLFFNLWRRTV